MVTSVLLVPGMNQEPYLTAAMPARAFPLASGSEKLPEGAGSSTSCLNLRIPFLQFYVLMHHLLVPTSQGAQQQTGVTSLTLCDNQASGSAWQELVRSLTTAPTFEVQRILKGAKAEQQPGTPGP